MQDTTSCKSINERITLNLPASTSVRQLFEDVAAKVGYVSGTFSLKCGHGDMVRELAVHSDGSSLGYRL